VVERVGWTTVVERARRALADLPEQTVLVGVSMGAGVVGAVWPERPATAGVVLLHAPADLPASTRAGLKVQMHAADPDEFAPPEQVDALRKSARRTGADLEIFRYPGVGHFYTDHELPDHSPAAAELTWNRVLNFLNRTGRPQPS
jgi:dienelactone hydrolase